MRKTKKIIKKPEVKKITTDAILISKDIFRTIQNWVPLTATGQLTLSLTFSHIHNIQ